MELVQIFEKEWAEVSYKKEVIEQKERGGKKKPVIRCIAQNKPNVSYTFLCGLAGPLCRALREYRYNIKPQCRAKSPFEQFTCAFLYPVPRHLSSDTPCNYKRKEKEMSFDYFHPYCLHTQSGLLGQLQQEAVDSCTSVWQRDDGSVESQTVTKKMTRFKIPCLHCRDSNIWSHSGHSESVGQNWKRFISFQDGNNQSPKPLFIFL